MRLSNWLHSLHIARTSRRRVLRSIRQVKRNPALQRVEQLESRLCLSGSAYATASGDWFGSLETSLQSVRSLTGSSEFVGPLPPGVIAHQYLVRLTLDATADAGSLAGVQPLLAGSSVDLQVSSGLGLAGQVLVATSEWDSVRVFDALRANPSIAYFEEDFTVTATRFPDEQTESPEFTRQYGLHNTGQTGGVADVDIDAPEAWDTTVGSTTTVVSVIDSGVDYTHRDLYLNVWLNQGEIPERFLPVGGMDRLVDTDSDGLITFRDLNDAANSTFVTDLNANGYIDAEDLLDDPQWADGIDTDGNGFEDDLVGWDFFEDDNRPFDEHRHGTHVAGILGGIGDNSFGIAGVNWAVSMMPLRFLDEDNKGDVSNAIEAINYTTMMRTRKDAAVNLRVSNNSWGASGVSSQALVDAVGGNLTADILFVAAAGNGDVLGQGINNDQTPFFPASLDLPNVISVAALNDRGELATFSNFGARTVDIAAPGVDIVSTEPGGTFISRSGTSMATPHVSGAAALVFDVHPEATAIEVRDAILTGADARAALSDRITAGRSLNAAAALTASTFAPVPELVAIPSITTTGVVEVAISVKYTDDNAVDTSTFDIRDIEITRDGFSQTLLQPFAATTTTIDSTDAAIYRVAVPGGEWDATENGIWTVRLREGEIRDNEGLYSAPRALGTFQVEIDDPNVIFVNTTADTVDADLLDGIAADTRGNTSLRAAIMHANNAGVPTTIVLPDGIYTLTIPGAGEDAAATGDLDLTSSDGISILGGAAPSTIIDAKQLDRIFDVDLPAIATIRGITVQNGSANQGGGIQNS
jgi:subtilisin family serine protease